MIIIGGPYPMTTSKPVQIILNEHKTNSPMIDIDIIKSPMKYEILELLCADPMNFEEIVGKHVKVKGKHLHAPQGLEKGGAS